MLGHLQAAGGWHGFVTRYCDGRKGVHGWEIDGASNLVELRNVLGGLGFVRREKSAVLTELPDKIRTFRIIEPDHAARKTIAEAKTGVMDAIAHRDQSMAPSSQQSLSEIAASAAPRADVLGAIAHLRKTVGVAKIPAACEWIDSTKEQGGKMLVFGHHAKVLDGIEDHLRTADISYVRLDGHTPSEKRQGLVDRFQATDSSVCVFLGSCQAAGQGLTLTAASQVLIVEQEWTPAEMDQAEDRAHRIGQHDTVMATHLIADGTIDGPVVKLITRKREVSAQAVEGTVMEPAVTESVETMLEALFSAESKNTRSSGHRRDDAARGAEKIAERGLAARAAEHAAQPAPVCCEGIDR